MGQYRVVAVVPNKNGTVTLVVEFTTSAHVLAENAAAQLRAVCAMFELEQIKGEPRVLETA
jgi:hypothetical protein